MHATNLYDSAREHSTAIFQSYDSAREHSTAIFQRYDAVRQSGGDWSPREVRLASIEQRITDCQTRRKAAILRAAQAISAAAETGALTC